ncbi:amidohydrolase 2 [Pluteus cervinus]|uniref:Amidohydrolase 2 n=1 Tax=Pluteus cervinus TaxID=181527 RepID=A0ACD3AH92_9AGAR|nr:amidohydrolase 2 [Pluteus cervinus]
MMSTKRIDTHFHILLPSFLEAVRAAGNDPAGWIVTEWSPQDAIAAMDKMGITKTLLSFTSPGPGVSGPGAEGKKLCRSLNEETLAIVKQYPDRFGWYASLPNWHDVEGTIEEVKWALNEATDGFIIMSNYDDMLLGDPKFEPIWAALNEVGAVVFIHPTETNIKPKYIASSVPQPLIDYPLATTRTAIDLVLTKTLAKNPDVKLILSHAGGALPFLADRVLSLVGLFGMSADDAKRDMQRFWLDVALSTSRSQLQVLLDFTTPDKLLFGTDWPYVKIDNALRLIKQLDDYLSNHPSSAELSQAIYHDNAAKLFGWTTLEVERPADAIDPSSVS